MASSASAPVPPRRVLVVNQHGDNRGDEAAMLAMLAGLRERLGSCHFTVVAQVSRPGEGFPVPPDTEFLRAVPRLRNVPSLIVLTLAARLRRPPPRRLLDGFSCRLADEYSAADLVVSAPGGPYFGDVYWNHEPLHWWYAWLGLQAGIPVGLFATSAGPYRRRLWNVGRRRLLRRFSRLVVREAVSAENLAGLLGPEVPVEITTDSALARRVAPMGRDELRVPDDRFLVAVSAIDRGAVSYDNAMRAALVHLAETRDAHFVVLPQRYGADSDVAYLEALMAPIADRVEWELFDPAADADAQRSMFAAADLVIAGRYHPLVFAISAGVPVVPVPYEHKAVGLAAAAGLEPYAIHSDVVTAQDLVARVDAALGASVSIREQLRTVEPELRAAARRTAEMIADLIAGPVAGPGSSNA